MIQNNGTLKTLHGSELIRLVRSCMETTFQIVVGVYLPAITPDLAEMESVVQDVCICARRGRHRLQNLALLASESGLPCFPCRVSSRLSLPSSPFPISRLPGELGKTAGWARQRPNHLVTGRKSDVTLFFLVLSFQKCAPSPLPGAHQSCLHGWGRPLPVGEKW